MTHGLHEPVGRVHHSPVQRAEIEETREPVDVDDRVYANGKCSASTSGVA